MPYVLGVHLGATTTSAAVARRDDGKWGGAAPFPLGSASPAVPTVLCRVQDGTFMAGEAAQRQEPAHHEWVARSFVHQVGDESPLMVGSEFVTAHRLAAVMIEWVADAVAHRQGHPAEHITVTHSATWGPHRRHLVSLELKQLGLHDVTLVPEPLAVVLDYSTQQGLSGHGVSDGGVLAIGNMGGSSFDATVLRRQTDSEPFGFEMLGSPLDGAHPSGRSLDDVVFDHVCSELAPGLEDLDPAEPRTRVSLLQLRAECARVKEVLSHQPDATARVELPELRTQVALSRAHYEQLARDHLERVPELLQQVTQSALTGSQEPDGIVLAGGAARTPLLRQLVTQQLQQQAQVDGAPELVAARGAALAAVRIVSAASDRSTVAETSVLMRVEGSEQDQDDLEVLDTNLPPAPRPPVEVEPMVVEPPVENRTFKVIKLSAAALLVIFGLVLTFAQGWSEPHNSRPGMVQQK
ncbi:molecular chaperone DnaK (HSP70) [Saccharopolyspora lacisalsi]|uniref:Molecular chaperone DnaK (HSP70) n=1 Tax=Halosaccharopolyspora lacisalsi TaxID=1000566 RepID=A0A839E2B1_9PSEU|nr:Hsp70 family protein [Halosaccharopolyspora lacisalsi]MBA8827403.1 molecular chaperone DnaK (HSP70) [Halosaccharopolyspora lacisalsi]